MKKFIFSSLLSCASLLAIEPNVTQCKPSGICITANETTNPFTGQPGTVIWVQLPDQQRYAISINTGGYREVVTDNKGNSYVLVLDFACKDINKVQVAKVVEEF